LESQLKKVKKTKKRILEMHVSVDKVRALRRIVSSAVLALATAASPAR